MAQIVNIYVLEIKREKEKEKEKEEEKDMWLWFWLWLCYMFAEIRYLTLPYSCFLPLPCLVLSCLCPFTVGSPGGGAAKYLVLLNRNVASRTQLCSTRSPCAASLYYYILFFYRQTVRLHREQSVWFLCVWCLCASLKS